MASRNVTVMNSLNLLEGGALFLIQTYQKYVKVTEKKETFINIRHDNIYVYITQSV
jgi:hypothetical protein